MPCGHWTTQSVQCAHGHVGQEGLHHSLPAVTMEKESQSQTLFSPLFTIFPSSFRHYKSVMMMMRLDIHFLNLLQRYIYIDRIQTIDPPPFTREAPARSILRKKRPFP
jgi:hypothetical protein